MNFEKNKDPKEAIGIGISEYLIQKITEHIKSYLSVPFKMELINRPHSNAVAEWINPSGAYMKLIKTEGNRFGSDTKYPLYYVEYDTGGTEYGNCQIEEFLTKPK